MFFLFFYFSATLFQNVCRLSNCKVISVLLFFVLSIFGHLCSVFPIISMNDINLSFIKKLLPLCSMFKRFVCRYVKCTTKGMEFL